MADRPSVFWAINAAAKAESAQYYTTLELTRRGVLVTAWERRSGGGKREQVGRFHEMQVTWEELTLGGDPEGAITWAIEAMNRALQAGMRSGVKHG